MKKGLLFIGIIAIATFFVAKSSPQKGVMQLTDLASVESIAACETSSNPDQNRGYCTKEFQGNKEHCVETGSGPEVRCSGNV